MERALHKIGLTGGICTGKTFVLQTLKELGCYTLRADDIAKDIIFSGRPKITNQIAEVFGPDILDDKRTINKQKFSEILFSDMEKRQFVNSVVHPLVKKERKKLFKKINGQELYDFFIYESALLVEANLHKEFEKIIVVYSTVEEQVRRLMERDHIDQEAAEAKIRAQLPLSEKLKVANYVIDTTGSFEISKKNTLEAFYLLKTDLNKES